MKGRCGSRAGTWPAVCAWLLLALGLVLAQPAQANTQAQALLLHAQAGVRALPVADAAMVAPGPRNLERAAAGQLPFQATQLLAHQPFDGHRELWIRLRLEPRAAEGSWHLEVALPLVDAVSTFERVDGRWVEGTAGDKVPIAAWPQRGRYPIFDLHLHAGAASDVYVRVRHSIPTSIPLRVVSSADLHQAMLLEYLVLGLLLGAVGLLVAGSGVLAVWLRDATYAWYALYCLLALVALASFTGVATHLLWGDLPAWSDAAAGSVALVGAAVSMVIARRLSPVGGGTRWLRHALALAAAAGLACAVGYALAERRIGIVMMGAHLFTVIVLVLVNALVIRRRDGRVGNWLMVATLPLCLAIFGVIGRVFGVLQTSPVTEYMLVIALGVHLPSLLIALNTRSEARRGAELRRLVAEHQDALTGLLKSEPFAAKLRQAVARYRHRGEDAAVALVEVRNYAVIKEQLGAEAAEEALLHAVIKLRRNVRDVDVTGRLAENRFGLILEGVAMRQPMNSLGPRLITQGLIRSRGQPASLQFHIAATLISEHGGSALELVGALEAMLEDMSPRTRRPFRYLPTAGMPAEPESQLTSQPEAAAASVTPS